MHACVSGGGWHQPSMRLLSHRHSAFIYIDHKFSEAHTDPEGELSRSEHFVHRSAATRNAHRWISIKSIQFSFRSAVFWQLCPGLVDLLCMSCVLTHIPPHSLTSHLKGSLLCVCTVTTWQREKAKNGLFTFHSRHFWLVMTTPPVPRFSF